MRTDKYLVFRIRDGCGEEYLGPAGSLRECRRMAAQHHRGERTSLPACLYETVRTGGVIHGLPAPPPPDTDTDAEPVAWFGAGGWYCAMRAAAESEQRPKHESRKTKHSWMKLRWGVSPGSERPYGVDEQWVCTRCGARKWRGPESLANGKRVIRWWYPGADGQEADRLPACTGGRSECATGGQRGQ